MQPEGRISIGYKSWRQQRHSEPSLKAWFVCSLLLVLSMPRSTLEILKNNGALEGDASRGCLVVVENKGGRAEVKEVGRRAKACLPRNALCMKARACRFRHGALHLPGYRTTPSSSSLPPVSSDVWHGLVERREIGSSVDDLLKL